MKCAWCNQLFEDEHALMLHTCKEMRGGKKTDEERAYNEDRLVFEDLEDDPLFREKD